MIRLTPTRLLMVLCTAMFVSHVVGIVRSGRLPDLEKAVVWYLMAFVCYHIWNRLFVNGQPKVDPRPPHGARSYPCRACRRRNCDAHA